MSANKNAVERPTINPLKAPNAEGFWWYFESAYSEPVCCWVVARCYAGERFGVPTGELTLGGQCGRREAGHLRNRDLRYAGGYWLPCQSPSLPKYDELLWPNTNPANE